MNRVGNHRNKKELSWIYKKKKKSKGLNNNQNVKGEMQNDEHKVLVRNLAFKVTENDLSELYKPFGEIQEISIPKNPDGTPVGCAFIQFKRMQDASKAIFNTNKKEFLGRTITSTWAIAQSKFCKKLEESITSTQKSNKNNEDKSAEEISKKRTLDSEEELENEHVQKKNIPKRKRKR